MSAASGILVSLAAVTVEFPQLILELQYPCKVRAIPWQPYHSQIHNDFGRSVPMMQSHRRSWALLSFVLVLALLLSACGPRPELPAAAPAEEPRSGALRRKQRPRQRAAEEAAASRRKSTPAKKPQCWPKWSLRANCLPSKNVSPSNPWFLSPTIQSENMAAPGTVHSAASRTSMRGAASTTTRSCAGRQPEPMRFCPTLPRTGNGTRKAQS